MHQRIRSHTQVCQTYHQENLIRLITANIENQKTKDAIKRKIIRNATNRTRQTHCRATQICLMKAVIKARDAINSKYIGKRNRTLLNYAQN